MFKVNAFDNITVYVQYILASFCFWLQLLRNKLNIISKIIAIF